jgi:hypothetical protein
MKKLAILLLCLLLGCARSTNGGGGTGTGNPGLTLESHGYNSLVSNSITALSFCVTEVRFITDTGISISVPESQLGLIDLGNGSQSVTWGHLDSAVPGTIINHVHIEIEHDHELCPSAAYSVSANGMTITTEVEFKFMFAQPFTVGNSGSVTFSLSTLITKINQAITDGKFNNGQIGNYLDGSFEDSATGTDD